MTDSDKLTFNRTPLVLLIVTALAAVIFYMTRSTIGWWSDLGFIISVATAISIVISEACDPFSDAAQWVGHRLQLPGSVRGATLDAIASSMPELFTGLFFVMVALSGDLSQVRASGGRIRWIWFDYRHLRRQFHLQLNPDPRFVRNHGFLHSPRTAHDFDRVRCVVSRWSLDVLRSSRSAGISLPA